MPQKKYDDAVVHPFRIDQLDSTVCTTASLVYLLFHVADKQPSKSMCFGLIRHVLYLGRIWLVKHVCHVMSCQSRNQFNQRTNLLLIISINQWLNDNLSIDHQPIANQSRSAVNFLTKIASTLGLHEIRSMGGAQLQFRNASLQFDTTGACDFGYLLRSL